MSMDYHATERAGDRSAAMRSARAFLLCWLLGGCSSPLAEARTMLIESFVAEALEKVEDEALRTALTRMALRRLAQLSA